MKFASPSIKTTKYLFALILVIFAASLRIWPLHILKTGQAWLTFYPAVTLAALYGGFYPGFFAALLSIITIYYGWPLLSTTAFVSTTADYIAMLVYLFNSSLIAVVAGFIQKLANEKNEANQLLQKANEQLNSLNDQLPGSVIYQSQTDANGHFYLRYISNGLSAYSTSSIKEILNNRESLLNCIVEEDRSRYATARQYANDRKETLNIDIRMYKLDGNKGWVNLISIPKVQKDGAVLWNGLLTDITSRKQLEQQLKQNEEFLKESNKLAKIGGWLLNAQTKEVFWSHEIYRMHELDEGTKITMQVSLANYLPGDRERIGNLLQKALTTGEGFTTEGQKQTNSGRLFWVSVICKPIIENGIVAALQGIVQEITERKELEIKLKQEQINNQRLLTEMVISEHEKKINSIAYELHEDINQLLVATKIKLEYLNPAQSDLQANIDISKTYLYEAIEKINHVFSEVNIPAFNELGFIQTIQTLVDKYRLNTTMHISFNYSQPGNWNELAAEIMLLLYGVLSDRLHFMQQKQKAHIVNIKLATVQESIKLTLELETTQMVENDEQIKFDLRILESRLAFYGGSLGLNYLKENQHILEITVPFVRKTSDKQKN